mmetsp:Transcript_17468/g.29397  ORF Transcript_17468/g.29397 Transcript_17468/m.29397 type:complete len:89 (+) Transcript_17468:196-462(+)
MKTKAYKHESGKRVKFQMYDIGGQEQFKTLAPNYFRCVQGIVTVFDCTDRESFNHVENWMRQVELFSPEGIDKIIVANKIDRQDRVIS